MAEKIYRHELGHYYFSVGEKYIYTIYKGISVEIGKSNLGDTFITMIPVMAKDTIPGSFDAGNPKTFECQDFSPPLDT